MGKVFEPFESYNRYVNVPFIEILRGFDMHLSNYTIYLHSINLSLLKLPVLTQSPSTMDNYYV